MLCSRELLDALENVLSGRFKALSPIFLCFLVARRIWYLQSASATLSTTLTGTSSRSGRLPGSVGGASPHNRAVEFATGFRLLDSESAQRRG